MIVLSLLSSSDLSVLKLGEKKGLKLSNRLRTVCYSHNPQSYPQAVFPIL